MLRGLSRVDKLAGSVANWAAVWVLVGGGAILTAALTWAGQYWDWLFGYGWGAVVFAAVGAVCAVGLTLALALLAIGVIAMARRPRDVPSAFTGPVPPMEVKYNLGLAGGDRYIEGDFGQVMNAYEERMTRQLEDRAHQLKTELAPQDHAEEIRKLESASNSTSTRVEGLFEDLKATRANIRYLLQLTALQTTIATIDALIQEAPPPEEREPTAEFHAKAVAYLDALLLSDIGKRHAVQQAIMLGKDEAEKLLKISQPPNLNGAALLEYRECLISVRQVGRAVAVLEQMKAGGEQEFRNDRAELLARLRPNS